MKNRLTYSDHIKSPSFDYGLTYSDLIKRHTFEERFNYLALHGKVSELTFGSNRYLNQTLYHLPEWRSLRHDIIIRDNGCDLGIPGRDIYGPITIHHINPITVEMVLDRDERVLDPENLICVSDRTHKAIHYGVVDSTFSDYSPRTPGDTCPWKKVRG